MALEPDPAFDLGVKILEHAHFDGFKLVLIFQNYARIKKAKLQTKTKKGAKLRNQ